MKFPVKYFFSEFEGNPKEVAYLVTFTDEILNGKLNFLHSDRFYSRKC